MIGALHGTCTGTSTRTVRISGSCPAHPASKNTTPTSSSLIIVELSTDKVKGFRFSWKEAVNFAQLLEAKADGVAVMLPEGARQ